MRVVKDIIRETLLSSTVFKDQNTLHSDYVPEDLPHRENELRELAASLRPLFQVSESASDVAFSSHIAIIGPAGVGKTVTVKYLLKELEKMAKQQSSVNVIVDYRNCWAIRSKSEIIRVVAREKFGLQSRGFSDTEIIENIISRLRATKTTLLLALDEVWALKGDEIASILNLPTEYGGSHRISYILISRPQQFRRIEPVLSHRIGHTMEMRPYNYEECLDILKYRASLAFKPGSVPDELLEMVAEACVKSRNIRDGLEILLRAGLRADKERKNQLTPEYIRWASENVFDSMRYDTLGQLTLHELLTALALAKRLASRQIVSVKLTDIYRQYRILCEEYRMEPRKEASFRNYLNKLVEMDLVNKTITGHRNKRGVHAKYSLNQVSANTLLERLHDLLEQKLNEQPSTS